MPKFSFFKPMRIACAAALLRNGRNKTSRMFIVFKIGRIKQNLFFCFFKHSKTYVAVKICGRLRFSTCKTSCAAFLTKIVHGIYLLKLLSVLLLAPQHFLYVIVQCAHWMHNELLPSLFAGYHFLMPQKRQDQHQKSNYCRMDLSS